MMEFIIFIILMLADLLDGNRTYYLSISDGTKGIREINVNDLSVDKVMDFTSLDSAYEEGINCQIN